MEDETLELHFKTIHEKIDEINVDNKREHSEIFSKLNAMAADIAALKVKSGIWGFIAGMVPVSITGIYLYIRSQIK